MDPRLALRDEGDGRDTGDDGKEDGKDGKEGSDEPSASTTFDKYFNTNVAIGKTLANGTECYAGICNGISYVSSTMETSMFKTAAQDGTACSAGMNAQTAMGNAVGANHDWTTLAAIGDLNYNNSNNRCTTVFRSIQASPQTNRIPRASPIVELFAGE